MTDTLDRLTEALRKDCLAMLTICPPGVAERLARTAREVLFADVDRVRASIDRMGAHLDLARRLTDADPAIHLPAIEEAKRNA